MVTADGIDEPTVPSEAVVAPQRSSSRVAHKRARGDDTTSSANEASAVAPGSAAADADAAAQEPAEAPAAVPASEFMERAELMFTLDTAGPTARQGARPPHAS